MTDPLGLLVGGAILLVATLLGARWQLAREEAGSRRTFELTFPADLSARAAEAAIRGLAGLLRSRWRRLFSRPAVVLEVHANRRGIRHLLKVPASVAPYVCSQLWASGIRLAEVAGDAAVPPLTAAAEFRRPEPGVPLTVAQPDAVAAGMLAALQPLRADERLVLQWVITPAIGSEVTAVPLDPPPRPSWWQLLLGAAPQHSGSPRVLVHDRDWREQPAFLATLRLGAAAPTPARSRQLVSQLTASLHRSRGAQATFRRRALSSAVVADRLQRGAAPITGFPCLVRADELAALVGFPIDGPVLPGLTLGGARQLAPETSVPSAGRVVGRATFPGAERALALSATDSLKHLHAIGPTGVGKSTLLLNLIARDMAAGAGVAVVDPKGDLVADVLARVPAGRERDVILVDPTDTARPIGFNLLAGADAAPELVTDQVVSIFHHLYAAFWGPRTDDIMRAALLTLAHEPGMTLCEVPLLLTDERFRGRLLSRIDDPVALEPFWGWYAGLSEGERAQAIGPVMNKLRTFLLRRRLRNVIGQADSTFELADVLADRKIFLVSLSKGLLGEDAAALLGSAILAGLWQAVQGRAALPPAERTPFFCHVDEFQDYLNLPTSLADVLAQARSYGFGLTLAHQHLAQLPPLIRQAVLSNARSKVVFQTAAADAALLAREFRPHLEARDLQGLGPYEAYFAAAVGSRVSRPASIATPPAPPETGRGQAARALSRQTYGRSRTDIERAIRSRIDGRPPAGPVGARRRP